MHLPVGSLSGGQRQALALLISTMTPIDLLILDEHTAALDPRSSETVMALTDRLVREKGLTTLMVTHNLRYAVEYGNRLLMLHQGEAVVNAPRGPAFGGGFGHAVWDKSALRWATEFRCKAVSQPCSEGEHHVPVRKRTGGT